MKVTKEFLMQKMAEKWAEENPELMEDIKDLAYRLTLFNEKWGTKINPTDFLPSQPPKE